jgi:hypothetical protein
MGDEDQEEEAALVDSFFLPGGLLADDDDYGGGDDGDKKSSNSIYYDDNNNGSNGAIREDDCDFGHSLVPSNPWQASSSSSSVQQRLATKEQKEEDKKTGGGGGMSDSVLQNEFAKEEFFPTIILQREVPTDDEQQQQQRQRQTLQSSTPPNDQILFQPCFVVDEEEVEQTPEELVYYGWNDTTCLLFSEKYHHFNHQQNQQQQQQQHSLNAPRILLGNNLQSPIVRPPPGFLLSSSKTDDDEEAAAANLSSQHMNNNYLEQQRRCVAENLECKEQKMHLTCIENVHIENQREEVRRPRTGVRSHSPPQQYSDIILGSNNPVKQSIKHLSVNQNYIDNGVDEDESGEEEEDDDDKEEEEEEEEEEVEEGDDAENDTPDDDEDNATIPLHIYSLSRTDSMTCSSLSTSSDFENSDDDDDDASGTLHGEMPMTDGGIGYDTDQAHVSQIVGVAESNDGRSASTTPSAIYSGERLLLPTSSSNSCQSRHQRQSSSQHCSILTSFVSFLLFVVSLPATLFRASCRAMRSMIRHSVVLTNGVKSFHRHCTDKYQRLITSLSKHLREFRDAMVTLVSQLITFACNTLAFLTKCLMLIFHIILHAWKLASLESIEEPEVANCYITFYFMPGFCSFLMCHCILPHWLPHLLTWMGVYSLCYQIDPGPLLQDEVDFLRYIRENLVERASAIWDTKSDLEYEEVSATGSTSSTTARRASLAPTGSSPIRRQQHADSHVPCRIPPDERACRTILKILRFVLPVFFVADGFSSEFGTIMGVSGASRLTTAFMMSLVRKNLVSTPIGWLSWAIQVLAATYVSQGALLDILVAIVGLSSIRMIRSLDGERAKKQGRA